MWAGGSLNMQLNAWFDTNPTRDGCMKERCIRCHVVAIFITISEIVTCNRILLQLVLVLSPAYLGSAINNT